MSRRSKKKQFRTNKEDEKFRNDMIEYSKPDNYDSICSRQGYKGTVLINLYDDDGKVVDHYTMQCDPNMEDEEYNKIVEDRENNWNRLRFGKPRKNNDEHNYGPQTHMDNYYSICARQGYKGTAILNVYDENKKVIDQRTVYCDPSIEEEGEEYEKIVEDRINNWNRVKQLQFGIPRRMTNKEDEEFRNDIIEYSKPSNYESICSRQGYKGTALVNIYNDDGKVIGQYTIACDPNMENEEYNKIVEDRENNWNRVKQLRFG